MQDTVVFYHGHCPDGFGAAFAAWLVFGDKAEYIPCLYGDEPKDVTGKRVYILDFSFEEPVMRRLDEQANSLFMLDHHKTAKTKLHGFQCRCGGIVFDLERSGAMMAWEYFHSHRAVPALIQHIQDRDLWRWELPESANYLAALDAAGYDFHVWKRVLEMTAQEHALFVSRGEAMNTKFAALCDTIADTALDITLLGHRGLMVNAPSEFSSDVGNRLAIRSGTFGVIWKLQSIDTVKVSLRSVDPFDVEQLAVALGGGGHPRASAFTLPLAKLPALLQGQL